MRYRDQPAFPELSLSTDSPPLGTVQAWLIVLRSVLLARGYPPVLVGTIDGFDSLSKVFGHRRNVLLADVTVCINLIKGFRKRSKFFMNLDSCFRPLTHCNWNLVD